MMLIGLSYELLFTIKRTSFVIAVSLSFRYYLLILFVWKVKIYCCFGFLLEHSLWRRV